MTPVQEFFTIEKPGSARHTVKMSRFLSFAIPVRSADEARAIVKQYQNQYHDSRHVCWAYMLGPERLEWQLNDNGEPSGTAGKPILGQINSREVTDVLVVVVRYFGGIKLGTPGLIAAYKEAASLALDDAGRKLCVRKLQLSIQFGYETADSVMKIIKNKNIEIADKRFDNLCGATILYPMNLDEEVRGRLSKIEGIMMEEPNESNS
ncbi:MAG: YigZ family protein [Muribaculaceae bacterium]|nr:YigZ family protein [Muribaculaceae bacterium]